MGKSGGGAAGATAGGGMAGSDAAAWGSFRAGEHADYSSPGPVGGQPSTYGSSMSPDASVNASQIGASTGGGGLGEGTDWKEALTDALSGLGGGGAGAPGAYGGAIGHVGYEVPGAKVPARVFALTPRQTQILRARGIDSQGAREHVLARAKAGDMSMGPYTAEQVQAAREG